MTGSNEQERAERLAAALRENLRRRKLQARGRKDAPVEDVPAMEPSLGGGNPVTFEK